MQLRHPSEPELHVLYASPLDQRIPQINIQGEPRSRSVGWLLAAKEVDLLQEALRKANCKMPGAKKCRKQACTPRNISVGTATTKSFAELLTLAQKSGGIILHLSVHVRILYMSGLNCVSQVVNAETNAGIVFENDYGGAHILYRPQLEELLGNGQQLEGLSFVFINGCSSDTCRPVSL